MINVMGSKASCHAGHHSMRNGCRTRLTWHCLCTPPLLPRPKLHRPGPFRVHEDHCHCPKSWAAVPHVTRRGLHLAHVCPRTFCDWLRLPQLLSAGHFGSAAILKSGAPVQWQMSSLAVLGPAPMPDSLFLLRPEPSTVALRVQTPSWSLPVPARAVREHRYGLSFLF